MDRIKSTATYKCTENINNLKIKIKIKETDSNEWIESVFNWQQKRLSKADEENKNEKNNIENSSILFSYVHEDRYQILESSGNDIEKALAQNEPEPNTNATFDFFDSLKKAYNPVISIEEQYMFLMADLGEFIGNKWVPDEEELLKLRYDKISQTLSIYPDFSSSPYKIKKKERKYLYVVENCSKDSDSVFEQELMSKMTAVKLQDHFDSADKNKLKCFYFIEILKGKGFENSGLFVQYSLDVPNIWIASGEIKGRTQSSSSVPAHFDHNFEVVLEKSINLELPQPCLNLEVVSKDSWNRFRTEGVTFQQLPIQPGSYEYSLNCVRFEKGLWGQLRRHFIGDCFNYNDVSWVNIPQDREGKVLNKFGVETVGTGEVGLRVNVVHQAEAFKEEFNKSRDKVIYEKLSASSLIKSVDQVLKAFKRARKNMMEARKGLD